MSFLFPSEFETKLRKALSLDLGYPERMPVPGEFPAAVLALFAQSVEMDSSNPTGLSLLVTRRTDSLQSHQGQMAFPGGRCEPDELTRGDFLGTALRETEEEVGISRHQIYEVGTLPELSTPSGYRILPQVGILKVAREELVLRPDPVEVAEALWVPWSVLMDPSVYQREMIQRGAIRFPTHVYTVQGHRIWGATGAMIKNLLDRFQRIG